MGILIDCSIEFKIRQRVNRVKQIIADKGWEHKLLVTLQPDATVDTGYGIVLWDRERKKMLELNMDLFNKAPH
jgi:hypothetical protein